jgi:DNA-binding IclR family transcriptional regulator
MMLYPISPQRAAILKVLQEAPGPMRVKDIAAAAQMKRTSVGMMLLRMRDDEQAEQHPVRGLWASAPFRR